MELNQRQYKALEEFIVQKEVIDHLLMNPEVQQMMKAYYNDEIKIVEEKEYISI